MNIVVDVIYRLYLVEICFMVFTIFVYRFIAKYVL